MMLCRTLAFNFNLPDRVLLAFDHIALLRNLVHFLPSSNQFKLLPLVSEIRGQGQI